MPKTAIQRLRTFMLSIVRVMDVVQLRGIYA